MHERSVGHFAVDDFISTVSVQSTFPSDGPTAHEQALTSRVSLCTVAVFLLSTSNGLVRLHSELNMTPRLCPAQPYS